MITIETLLCDPKSDIYLGFWKDDHLRIFVVKIPNRNDIIPLLILFYLFNKFLTFCVCNKSLP